MSCQTAAATSCPSKVVCHLNGITDLQGAINFDALTPVVISYWETTNRIFSLFFICSTFNRPYREHELARRAFRVVVP